MSRPEVIPAVGLFVWLKEKIYCLRYARPPQEVLG